MADQVLTREILSITKTNATKADKELASRFNQVAWRALGQAEMYLIEGPEAARLAVTKSFLTSISKLASLDTKTEIEQHRLAFLGTLKSMTEIEESLPVVTADEIYDAISHDPLPSPSPRQSHDQDDLPTT